MSRALLYARQSETSGDGDRSLSLDSQIAELRRDAERHGWVIVGEIRDADAKGWDPKRPGLLEVYRRCQEGGVDVVAFWSLSRLARKVRITEEIFDTLGALGVSLYSNQESWVAEPMMRQVFSAFAEQQTRDTRAHVRRAVRERARRGLPHGPAPLGYQRNDAGKLTPTADAELVRQMYRWRIAGLSETAIAVRLTERGEPAPGGARVWSRPTVTGILTNPTYRGAVRLADVIEDDAHEALIAPVDWHAAQQCRRTRPRAPRSKPIRSWLEGMIEHGCGAPMYLTGGSPGRPPIAFRCRVGGGWGEVGSTCDLRPRQMPAAQAERMVWQTVTDTLADLPALGSVYDRARREYRAAIPLADTAVREAQERHRRAVARRKRAESLYLSGARERAWFDAEDTVVAAEIAAADAVLARLPVPPDKAQIEATWRGLRELRSALSRYGDDEKAAVLHTLGVAVISPAGYRVGRADAGVVTIRFRSELRAFFGD